MKLNRKTFSTSRHLEFFSEKELNLQIGHEKEKWGLALLKELIDNALDACEIMDKPKIQIEIGEDFFSVQDNGHGIPTSTIEKSLDYSTRTSDKNHYITPTRGQLGNALKCLWAAPFVVNGDYGRIEVASHDEHRVIEVKLDRIAQKPEIKIESELQNVKTGTFFKIYWDNLSSSIDNEKNLIFYLSQVPTIELIQGFAIVNPHVQFELTHNNKSFIFNELTENRLKKWYSNDLPSAHWYNFENLRGLIAAHLNHDKSSNQTLREKKNSKIDIKAAAYEVMESAYLKASDNGKLPANARQIMYAARPLILQLTEKSKLDDSYFTQTLLPDFIKENPELTSDWNVVYDARGRFLEPHTNRTINLGTLGVRDYLDSWCNNIISDDLRNASINGKLTNTFGQCNLEPLLE